MHPHRSSALGYASAASAAHSRVYGACAAEAAASESSRLSVGGCIRACRDFRPYPVVCVCLCVLPDPDTLYGISTLHITPADPLRIRYMRRCPGGGLLFHTRPKHTQFDHIL